MDPQHCSEDKDQGQAIQRSNIFAIGSWSILPMRIQKSKSNPALKPDKNTNRKSVIGHTSSKAGTTTSYVGHSQ